MSEVLECLREVGFLSASVVAAVAVFIDCGRGELVYCYIGVREIEECAGFGDNHIVKEAERNFNMRSETELHSKSNVGDVSLEGNRCNRCFVTTDCVRDLFFKLDL